MTKNRPSDSRKAAELIVGPEILAAALGVTTRRVGQLAEANVAIKVDRARYDLIGTLRRIRELEDENGSKAGATSEARSRYWAAKAGLAEYELAEKRRIMVNMDDVEKIFARDYSACRNRLLPIPTKIAGELATETDAKKCSAIVERELYEAIAELNGGNGDGEDDDAPDGSGGASGPRGDGEAGAGETSAAPAATDALSVGRAEPYPEPRKHCRARPLAE